ncbi:acyl-CoA dehydrogenase family protein [Rhodohalobacter halophilus]|uniref:acyl-CoA dehydrogenase family protein n=1 Tax=Rhodohalobacter halophilus TaxID=1812810 RepID=UPI000B006981|nr:acyl-CoA dehydrogenase family protein [Rhodohalobacter halophilus]
MDLNVAQSLNIKKDITSFLSDYKQKLSELFNERNDEDEMLATRGLPPYVLREVLEHNPLSTFIPDEYNGRGAITSEALSMLETTSYQSLPLSLMMGINGALFLQPVANYGEEEAKKNVFQRFLKKKNMGGLMITEPDFGSDALRMQTGYRYNEESDSYKIEGLKHWAGLTGWADFWLITARETDKNGELGRDIGFFIHDSSNGGIEVLEYYKNLGLYMLPYGKNQINIDVPASYKLNPSRNGILMMLDILHRSRLQFPGMSTGHLKRMMDEALAHCKERLVGGQSLFNYDQVKERLAQLQSYFTVSSAMSFFTGTNVPLTKNTARMDVAANSIKSVVTDYMHEASQSLMQLVGAKGYRLDHIAGRAMVDSRPFQIFEGSNDILYQQISESVLKMMRKSKESNLYQFMKGYSLTENAAGYFKDTLNFEVDYKLPQRKLVQLGRALGRLVSMEMTLKLGDTGFNSKMISNSLKVLRSEINSIVSTYKSNEQPDVLDGYGDDSSWLKFVKA